MAKQSAGILPYRYHNDVLEVFIVHPGGPFWAKKDIGVWSVAKGEYLDGEEPIAAAMREFEEETGQTINGDFIELKPIKQKNGKTVYCWAVEAEVDETNVKSNTFPFEYPPKSGKFMIIPEVDKGGWFNSETAKEKVIPAQAELITQLEHLIEGSKN